ncbi:UDP-N-acetylglucosamine 2-epimerase (non-hydrolysing) [Plasticicumulans lactativorans]|uniref:UDP-N-acetylglucosamine 2-epimerase (Non-hydrolysing) n=1 Tax=Plasticicumulans lactativorans TaxID=1133106 RepID=A0A4R2LLP4_9GAMM|nr:UDP-N-acetylglucosamine 2-epimerase (non-hydrolyzing) [Plasticicumulans lactativorans]TCO80345.1 UDP-N-acetylglucosamine 2-epimerase (non-hydrolysing) [Plasticicumulans lactativorans]
MSNPTPMPSLGNKILCIVGARPNFMKIAPIMAAFRTRTPQLAVKLVHTGQHYDVAMNGRFFEQLGIPAPDISLEVGSGSHAQQTAEIMKRFEPVIDAEAPTVVLVVGDVNSTIACALVAAKRRVKVVHVEAGLRSRDRSMPEEINRILTDQLSDRLYTTEAEALDNLVAEGIAAERVVFAGNVMIDTLQASLAQAVPAEATLAAARDPEIFLQASQGYAVLTLHRPSNVDDVQALTRLLTVLGELSAELPIVFPVHPRTQNKIREAGLGAFLDNPHLLALPPVGYFEMIGLMREAKLVLTDSGGLQEETTALGVPCLTLRENTERLITLSQGTNTLVGADPDTIRKAVNDVLTTGGKVGRAPALWDGHAAERIVDDLACWLGVSA